MAKSDNSLSSPSDASVSSSTITNSFGGGALGGAQNPGDDKITVPAHEEMKKANDKGMPAHVHPHDVARAAVALIHDIADPVISKAQSWHHAEKQKKAAEDHKVGNSLLGTGQSSVASAAGNDLAEKIYVAQVDLKANPKDMSDAAQKSVAAAAAFNGAQAAPAKT